MEDPYYVEKTIPTEYFIRAYKFDKLKISEDVKA